MSALLEFHREWLPLDGLRVSVDGKRYTIRVHVFQARWPGSDAWITVYADPLDKRDPEYLKTKQALGDDWSIDLLETDVERSTQFLLAGQAALAKADRDADRLEAALEAAGRRVA